MEPNEQFPGTARVWNADTLRLVRDIDAVLQSKPVDRQALVALRLAIAEMLGSCDALTLQALSDLTPPGAEAVGTPLAGATATQVAKRTRGRRRPK